MFSRCRCHSSVRSSNSRCCDIAFKVQASMGKQALVGHLDGNTPDSPKKAEENKNDLPIGHNFFEEGNGPEC